METHSSVLAWRIPMDRGAWRVTIHGVAKSRTRLSDEGQHSTQSLVVKLSRVLWGPPGYRHPSFQPSWPNKSLLLVVVASLMTMSAGAQLKKSDVARPPKHLEPITQITPVVTEREMLMCNPGTPVEARAKSPATSRPYYRRPAGVFFSPLMAEDGHAENYLVWNLQ